MRQTLFIFCLILFSCSGLKHWRYVASDEKVTPQKKAIVAPQFARLFPPTVKTVPGETIVKLDTVIHDRYYTVHDTLTNSDTVIQVKTQIITKTIHKTDTLYQVDNSALFSAQQDLKACEVISGGMQTLNDEQGKSIAGLKKGQFKWLWWLIALGVLNIVYIVIKLVK